MKNTTDPIGKKEEMTNGPDDKMDPDFADYVHSPVKKGVIPPETRLQREIADTDNNAGEKRIYRKDETDEQDSDGSANAFEDK
jgi:hypothetical protein